MRELQTIASFVQAHEAYLSAARLEEEGIKSEIQNETSTQVYSMISDQMGGVRLQVDRENAQRAYGVLLQDGFVSPPKSAEEDILFYNLTSKVPIISSLPPSYQLPATIMALIVILLFGAIVSSAR